MQSDRVLIVDDNVANLKLARIVLSLAGYTVETAVDAEQAQAALATFSPRLILMDLQLPGMDGLELTRRIKADTTTRGIIVLAVTAYAMRGDKERAIRAGCDGYLTKPIDTRTLAETVAGYLESSL